jgi:hypothetical protein
MLLGGALFRLYSLGLGGFGGAPVVLLARRRALHQIV